MGGILFSHAPRLHIGPKSVIYWREYSKIARFWLVRTRGLPLSVLEAIAQAYTTVNHRIYAYSIPATDEIGIFMPSFSGRNGNIREFLFLLRIAQSVMQKAEVTIMITYKNNDPDKLHSRSRRTICVLKKGVMVKSDMIP